ESTDKINIDTARERARAVIARIKQGKPAVEPPQPTADSFATITESWLRRHVRARGLRTADSIEWCLKKYVTPHWGNRPLAEIKRLDVAKLLDFVEDKHGARMADVVLTNVSSLMHWFARRDDSYVVPIVRGMRRSTNGARERVLNDDEIRLFWNAAGDC